MGENIGKLGSQTSGLISSRRNVRSTVINKCIGGLLEPTALLAYNGDFTAIVVLKLDLITCP